MNEASRHPGKLTAGALAVLVLATLGVATLLIGGAERTVQGLMTVYGTSCPPTGGYSDLRAGAPVKITSGSGELLALGRTESPGGDYSATGSCTFTFEVGGVSPRHDFYGVEIANRGAVMYDRDDVFNEVLTLTIGS